MLKIQNLSLNKNGISLQDIQASIKQGDFYVLFGPDDAGKTELISAIMGFTKPESGEILYKENPLHKSKTRKSIRFVPDGVLMEEKLRVRSYLNAMLRTYGIKQRETMERLIERFEIDVNEYLTDMTYEGNKLVTIIGALITEPELLILDEPFNFLTEAGNQKLMEALKEFNNEGMTILLVAEHFEDACGCGNRYLYLNDGKLIKEDDFKQDSMNHAKKLTVNINSSEKKAPQLLEKLNEKLGNHIQEEDDCYIYIFYEDLQKLGKVLKDCGIDDRDIVIEKARLEDVLNVNA